MSSSSRTSSLQRRLSLCTIQTRQLAEAGVSIGRKFLWRHTYCIGTISQIGGFDAQFDTDPRKRFQISARSEKAALSNPWGMSSSRWSRRARDCTCIQSAARSHNLWLRLRSFHCLFLSNTVCKPHAHPREYMRTRVSNLFRLISMWFLIRISNVCYIYGWN